VIGRSRTRLPVAWNTALVLAGATVFGLIVWCAALAFFFLAQAAPAAKTAAAEP